MKYTFKMNEGGYPEFGVEEKYWQLWELSSCNMNYLNEIVSSLKQVLLGELEQYDFGYEVYSIECRKEKSKVVDTFDGWKPIYEIKTQEVYELMKDWREYLIEHDKNKSL